MEITKHFIRAPSTNGSDNSGVNSGIEKCISAGCSETVGRYIRFKESQRRTHKSDCLLDGSGNLVRGDWFPRALYKDQGLWGKRWSIILTQGNHNADWNKDGAKNRVTTESQTNGFSSDTIFCRSKVKEANIAQWSCASEAVVWSRQQPLRKSWTLQKSKGWVSLGDAVYLPGRERKKKTRFALLPATNWIVRITWTGIGFSLLGGGSFFFQLLIIRTMQKLIFLELFNLGSLAPTPRSIWPMCRR